MRVLCVQKKSPVDLTSVDPNAIFPRRLCRNVIFHYATGVGAGVAFSLLVLTYFAQKRFRASWASWVLGVYSVSLYFLTSLWYNLRAYLVDNQAYLVGYLLVTGGVSFAVCYRMV